MRISRQFLLLISTLLIISSIVCNFSGNQNSQNSQIETDVASTMIALYVTQTVHAIQSNHTPTIQQQLLASNTPFPTKSPSQTNTLPPTKNVPPATKEPTKKAPGSISGSLSFPSEYIPPLRVIAFNINTGYYYYVITVQNQSSYSIEGLPPGFYHVVAYTLDNTGSAGYSQAVLCGLSVNCNDHSLIDVKVESNSKTKNVDPGDWYAPDGTFPPSPVQ